jgi:hypothetical protein
MGMYCGQNDAHFESSICSNPDHWPWLIVAACAIAFGVIARDEFDLYLESLVLTRH